MKKTQLNQKINKKEEEVKALLKEKRKFLSPKKLRLWNIISIALFLGTILFFKFFFTTTETDTVLRYFIPDICLAIANSFMTFLCYNDIEKLRKFFTKLAVFIILVAYYINICSAFFYIWLYFDRTIINPNEKSSYEMLWQQFNDIMKFKITATFHAIMFKHYADHLKKTVNPQ